MDGLIAYVLAKKYTTQKVNEIMALGPFTYDGVVPTKSQLPNPTEALKGHIYTVADEGQDYLCTGITWREWGHLPAVTAADDNKVLGVVDGAWRAANINIIDGGTGNE